MKNRSLAIYARRWVLASLITCCFLFVCTTSNADEKSVALSQIAKPNKKSPLRGWPKPDRIDEARYTGSISLVRLLSHSQDLHKRFVATEGFIIVGREAYLFLDELQAKRRLFGNAIILHPKESSIKKEFDKFQSKYVFVEGVFDRFDKDPLVCPNGSLSVSRILETGITVE